MARYNTSHAVGPHNRQTSRAEKEKYVYTRRFFLEISM